MAKWKETFKASREVLIRTNLWSATVKHYESVLGLPVTHRGDAIMGFEAGALCVYVDKGVELGPAFELPVADVIEAQGYLLEAGCTLVEDDVSVPRCYLRDWYGITYNIGLDCGREP